MEKEYFKGSYIVDEDGTNVKIKSVGIDFNPIIRVYVNDILWKEFLNKKEAVTAIKERFPKTKKWKL